MIVSAIDIGSNSVRLALFSDGRLLEKRMCTTRLGQGVNGSGLLRSDAIDRTARAVADFAVSAKALGADKVYAFATAAVRSARNGAEFVSAVKELCGIEVDVVDGRTEALLGLSGALKGGDGGIIDVGGASCEVCIRSKGDVVYSKSVNVGTVRLSEIAGRDRDALEKAVAEKIREYGDFDASGIRMCAIGGTATRLAAIKHGVLSYTPSVTDGTVLSLDELEELTRLLLQRSVEWIRENTICSRSADIVGGGCLLLMRVMQRFGVKEITVSESDNLEGYVILKEGRL